MNWIRTVYLYLFAMIGLVLLAVGGVQLTSLALRTFIFTAADAQVREWYPAEPPARALSPALAETLADDTTLTQRERAALRHWAEDYERWREQRAQVDPLRAQRQREAARALAFLIVGVPIWGYHWRTIRREEKRARRRPPQDPAIPV